MLVANGPGLTAVSNPSRNAVTKGAGDAAFLAVEVENFGYICADSVSVAACFVVS